MEHIHPPTKHPHHRILLAMHNLKQLISNRNNELHNRKHTRMENNHLLKRVHINFWNPNRIRTTTTSIYATYIPTSTTTPTSTPTPTIAPTPTPTPIQTPSPTPTPTPILAPVENSLISINDGAWYTDSQWLQCPALNVRLDTTDTCGGSPSWEITGNAVNLGVDYGGLGVAPGDKIVFSC